MNEQLHNPEIEPLYQALGAIPQDHDGDRTFGQYLADRLSNTQTDKLTPQIAAQGLVLLLADCIEGVDAFTGEPLPARLQIGEKTSATVAVDERGIHIENMDGLTRVLGGIGIGLLNRAYGPVFAAQTCQVLFGKPTAK